MTSPTERRRHARVAVRLPAVLTAVGARAAGEVVDLSLSRCRVLTDARVVPGERLRVALDLGGDGGMVACEAIVARVPGAGLVALSFGGFEADGEARLTGFVTARLGYADIGQSSPGRVTRVRRRLGSSEFWLLVLLLALGAIVLVTMVPWFHFCTWGRDC
ncbi:MAG: PilZ domain-containing protein [Candidatus Rokuibacteriota bacterium]